MIYKTLQKITIIESDDPVEFEKRFNQAQEELAPYKSKTTFPTHRGTHCAYIEYEQNVKVPEDIRDEYALRGISYICGDCPYFRPAEDRRVKHAECEKGQRTTYTTTACVGLYEAIERGEIEIEAQPVNQSRKETYWERRGGWRE